MTAHDPVTSALAPALTRASLAVAVDRLAAADPDLAAIIERFGLPPLWDRAPGFATLIHIILGSGLNSVGPGPRSNRRCEPRPSP